MKTKSYSRAAIYAGLPLVLAITPGIVRAQSAAPAPATAAGSADAGGAAEIIVTAEKRSVSLQKAPAAITVVSGASLNARGVQDVAQLQVTLPSVSIGKTAVGTRVFMRGVGQRFDSANTEPLVAVNMNGIGIIREALGGSNMYDIDRLEGLPGPQGTLYGNTAVGGVINVEFKKPVYENEGSIELEKGNLDLSRVTGVVNGALSPKAAIRIAVNYNYQDSYLRSGAGKRDDFSLRVSGKADLTEQLTAFVWGQYSLIRGTTVSSVIYPYIGDPYDDTVGNPGGTNGPAGTPPKPGRRRGNLHILGGNIAYNFGEWDLSYSPSYVKNDSYTPFNLQNSTFDIQSHTRQISNELRLSNDPSSALKFVGGLYHANQRYVNFLALRTAPIGGAPGFNVSIPKSRQVNLSAYAQGIYSVSDALRLTAGLRYGSSDRNATYDTTERGAIVTRNNSYKKKYNHADYKLGVEADLTPVNMLYAVFQTGYAPGTYSIVPPASNNGKATVDPTNLRSYTAGVKNRFFDRALTFNVEGFYYDYRDLQISQLNATIGKNQFLNAQKVEIYGVQFDTSLAIGRYTEIHGQAAYLHARNKKFIVPGGLIDYSGLTPVYSPKWTANIGASQRFPLANTGELVFRIDSHMETSSWGQFDHRPGTTDVGLSSLNEGYRKTDLALTYESPGGRYHVGVTVRNLEDKARVAAANSSTATLATGFPEPPRTYSLIVGANF